MKKLMTSTIILLPLLILAVMLVSGAIMSLITHIYVESVEFGENDTLVLVMSDEQSRPTEQLEVNVLPLKAANRGLVYSTENEDIVTVDENGVVTAQYYGETYITVTSAENKAATAKRKILVTDTSVHKLVINEEDAELYEGEPKELSVTVYPKEAENKSVTWTSSDESILHVSANGTVTPVGRGTATVTAVSNDNGEAKDTVTFTCHKKLKDLGVDQVGVVTSARTVKFPSVTRIPDDADADIAYKSSDPSVATVDGEGNIVFQKAGKVAITVIATDFGGKTVEKVKEFTSTDGYYLPPLFEKREYTVDFDTYFKDGKATEALPIPFATALEGSYQEFKEVTYDVAGVLTFDEDAKKFYFAGEMPAGTKTVTVTATARVYKTAEGAVSDYNDSFTLTVLRNASGVSLSYMGTPDVAHISTSSKTLKLYEGVNALPENHTNTVSYRLTEETDVASVDGSGTLTFQKAGEVTVRVELHGENGAVTVYKELGVAYAPAAGGKSVSFTGEQRTASLLLSMAKSEQGILYFNEPAGADVTYAVEGGANAAVKLEERGGVKYIVSQKGGFANVEIKVVPKAAAADMGTPSAATYTVRVYSDCPVRAENFVVKFNREGTPCTQYFGTTAHETVPYTVTVDGADGAMEGKKLYVQYGSAKDAANEGAPTQSGSIAFGEALSTLKVTFGVEYGEEAAKLGAKDGLSDTERTIVRNAESIAVSHKEADAAKISTWQQTLTFTTETTAGEETVNLSVLPANHTNTVVYSLTEGGEYAEITSAGALTFKETTEAHSVTVKISLRAMDGSILAEPCKEIEIAYAPRGAEDKEVSLSDAQREAKLLLRMGDGKNDKGILRFTEPGDATVTYQVTKGTAVKVVEESGTQHIVPQEGGFATVTVTVAPNAGGENKTYTVEVYVDNILHAEDLTFSFTDGVDTKGTKAETVTFTVQVNGGEGRMQGKRLIVTAAGNDKKKGEDDAETYTDNLTFPKSSAELTVSFGTEYTEEALKFKASGGLANSKTATVGRNAEEIKVTYGGVQTEKILTSENTITFAETNTKGSDVLVEITPVHTDVLSYTLEDKSGVAKKLNGGTLTFQEAGAVTVKIQLKRGGEVTLEKDISVTYAPVTEKTQEKVEIGKDEGTSSDAPVKIVLPTENGETKDGVIYFTEPEGTEVTYAVEEGAEAAVKVEKNADGAWHIIAQKGGFATIVITVTPKAESMRITRSVRTMSATATRYIKVYVDKPVTAADLFVTFNGARYDKADFLTSLTSVGYAVTVADKSDGAMAGKRIYVSGISSDPVKAEAGEYSYTGTFNFEKDSYTLRFGVEYAQAALDLGAKADDLAAVQIARNVETTKGNLREYPTVTYGEEGREQLNQDGSAVLTFEDIGEKIVFTVGNAFSPADFEISESKIEIVGNENVSVTKAIENGVATVTLTALKPVAESGMALSIGGKQFEFKVTVHAKAQKLSVSCGDTLLDEETEYSTLLDSLVFNVTLGRNDGNDITTKDLQWRLGDTDNWTDVTNSNSTTTLTVSGISTSGGNSIFIRSADGGVTFQLLIEKVASADFPFGLEFHAKMTGADNQLIGKIETVEGSEHVSYSLPSNMVGTVTVKVIGKAENLLGGFGTVDEFKKLATCNLGDAVSEGWKVEYASERGEIILSNIGGGNFNHTVTFELFTRSVSVGLSHIKLARIEFDGFDSANKVNGGDVYKGYQQVRVFAKHSDYAELAGGTRTNNRVDYFKLPAVAFGDAAGQESVDLALLTWTFTGYRGNAPMAETFTLTQTGTTVTFNGVTYTIVKNTEAGKPSTLEKADGTVIAANGTYASGQTQVPWVDVYAETGVAYLYFGEFTGLSEVDVQNDLFGNFDDKPTWDKPANVYNVEGTKIEPTDSSFTFLRVEAGDGAQGGINRHFNFNVLADGELTNVFNATGYYQYSKVVLHHDLYGNGELSADSQIERDAKANDQVMDKVFTHADWTSPAAYAKTTVYGNGYQINLNSLNDMIIGDDGYLTNNGGTENTGSHTEFLNIYNVNLKGRNDTDKVISTQMGVYFNIHNAYYSTVQNYGKLFNGSLHAKNTVFRNVAMAAIELWDNRDGAKASCVDYLENVTIVNAKRAIILENHGGHTLNIKGYFDALNYNSFNGIKDLATAAIDDAMVLQLLAGSAAFNQQSIDKYLEWFGCNYSVSLSSGNMDGANNFFVNPMIIDVSQDEGKTKQVTGARSKYGMTASQFYIDEAGDVVRGGKDENGNYPTAPNPGVTWVWTESRTNVGGVGGIINVWDESSHTYLNIKDNPEKSNFATPLSGMDHIDPRFLTEDILKKYESKFGSASTWGNSLISGYTFNTRNTIDGGQCTVTPDNADGTYDFYHFNATATRNLGKLFTSEREVRLLCEYVDIDDNGNPILNTDHILWHMQKAYRDTDLIVGRLDHIADLKESLQNAQARGDWDGNWPDGTTFQSALDAEAQANAAALTAMLSETVLPSKHPFE